MEWIESESFAEGASSGKAGAASSTIAPNTPGIIGRGDLTRLAGGASMNGERMNRTGQFVGQDIMNGAMPVKPAFAFKGRRHNINTEMRFAFRPRAGMAGMQVGFIDHLKA